MESKIEERAIAGFASRAVDFSFVAIEAGRRVSDPQI
jgi:hypothetical protein